MSVALDNSYCCLVACDSHMAMKSSDLWVDLSSASIKCCLDRQL